MPGEAGRVSHPAGCIPNIPHPIDARERHEEPWSVYLKESLEMKHPRATSLADDGSCVRSSEGANLSQK